MFRFQRIENLIVDDWMRHDGNFGILRHAYRTMSSISGSVSNKNSIVTYCNYIARNGISRGVKLLSRGRVVITDRIHAHIVSGLLDMPQVALDNHYEELVII